MTTMHRLLPFLFLLFWTTGQAAEDQAAILQRSCQSILASAQNLAWDGHHIEDVCLGLDHVEQLMCLDLGREQRGGLSEELIETCLKSTGYFSAPLSERRVRYEMARRMDAAAREMAGNSLWHRAKANLQWIKGTLAFLLSGSAVYLLIAQDMETLALPAANTGLGQLVTLAICAGGLYLSWETMKGYILRDLHRERSKAGADEVLHLKEILTEIFTQALVNHGLEYEVESVELRLVDKEAGLLRIESIGLSGGEQSLSIRPAIDPVHGLIFKLYEKKGLRLHEVATLEP